MIRSLKNFAVLLLAMGLQQCSFSQTDTASAKKTAIMDTTKNNNPVYSNTDSSKVNLTEEEWKKILPADVYYIARQKGTERPWTSVYEDFK